MKILVTGSNGFIAQNLLVRLGELGYDDVMCFNRNSSTDQLENMVQRADFVFHLAGVNRPKTDKEFEEGNANLTHLLLEKLVEANKNIPVVFSSSIQATLNNSYGLSKASAEQKVLEYQKETGSKVFIFRLPNVFGKWCKPNYNSAVATFCYNTLNELPITINDAKATLKLAYIDDVCDSFIASMDEMSIDGFKEIEPIYQTSVGSVVEQLQKFKEGRESLMTESVGTGLTRALYSTYLSYYKPEQFAYSVPAHTDPRGTFVEMLKTPDAGQFSFFTAHPGVTRGGHYHHTKNEKFLLIKGDACYRFKNIISGESYKIITTASECKVVETVPGWTHDITNIGDDELIVMLWANEIFDRSKPDTITSELT